MVPVEAVDPGRDECHDPDARFRTLPPSAPVGAVDIAAIAGLDSQLGAVASAAKMLTSRITRRRFFATRPDRL